MGRPRKQPRRITTFNLNLDLAEAIDDLPIKNRSDWANKVLQEVLDGRAEAKKEAAAIARDDRAFEIQAELLDSLTKDPARLARMLHVSLVQAGLEDYKPKGRYPLAELALSAGNPNDPRSLVFTGDA